MISFLSCRPVITTFSNVNEEVSEYKALIDSLSGNFTRCYPLKDTSVQVDGSYFFNAGYHSEYLSLDSTKTYKHTGWGDFGGKYRIGKGSWKRDESILFLIDRRGNNKMYYLFSDSSRIYIVHEDAVNHISDLYHEFDSLTTKFSDEERDRMAELFFGHSEILVSSDD